MRYFNFSNARIKRGKFKKVVASTSRSSGEKSPKARINRKVINGNLLKQINEFLILKKILTEDERDMDFLQFSEIVKLPIHLYNYCKRTKKSLISLELGIYWFWAAFRVLLTVLPQTGYIHPDEFFQTVEVFAGKAFDTEVSLPWEFNSSLPIRSIPLIYTTFYIPLSFLRRFSDFTEFYLGFCLINHYFLLVVPRLSMCLVSFISDICLFKICYYFGQNYKERLVIYGSSYVCLVFMTRTFTNTVEITCFNILLCLVASCMAESEKVLYQRDFLKGKYNEATTIPDQVRVQKLMKLLPKHSLKKCIPIAVATVSGFFNRPTFVVFAVTPLFYWFQRGLDMKSTYLKDFHLRIFLFVFYCIPVVCFFIYCDSVYYGYFTWGEVFNLKISSDNFVVTPFNFIKYNIDSSNLSKHGLHPRFLHVLVNIPLLFNVLGLSGLLVIAKLFYRGSFSNWTLLPKSQSITGMMTLSVIVPVLGLSFFPHQEPRFIIPILLPLIFLYSHIVRDFEEECKSLVPFRKRHPKQKEHKGVLKYPLKCINYFEKATENFDNRYNITGRYFDKFKNQEIMETTKNLPKAEPETRKPVEVEKKKGNRNDLVKFWFLLNALCVFFFGFLHQGGVYGLTKTFHAKLLVKPKYLSYHLVTSHTYSLPLHLLNLKRHYKYRNTKFILYELGSESFDKINVKLTNILKVSESKRKERKRNYEVFYALPGSLLAEFGRNDSFRNFTYEIRQSFYPHFSTEAPPRFSADFAAKGKRSDFSGVAALLNHVDVLPVRYLLEFLKQFSLVLVQVRQE